MQRLIDQLIDATGGEWPSNDFRCRVQKTLITRAGFEARKAERQNKPSWGECPDWAHYVAQDANGDWHWFSHEPRAKLANGWNSILGKYGFSQSGKVIGDWRNTLEQRPNHIGESDEKGDVDAAIEAMRDIRTAFANQAVSQFNASARYVDKHPCGLSKVEVTVEPDIDFELTAASVHPGLGGKLLLDKVMETAGNAFAKHAQLATEECFALMRESQAKSDNSADWYDYDKQEATKLPPVGAVVNFEWGGYHRGAVEIVAYRNNGNTAVLWNVDRDAPDAAEVMSSSFRPLDWNRKQEVPSPSPELSFHLSNAFNELQASARLLPEDDPRRASIVSLAGGVSAVKEVA